LSKLKWQDDPVIHIPTFKTWIASRSDVRNVVRALGLEEMMPYGVHGSYAYTDPDGAAKLLPNLLLKSNLYKTARFTCINYAFKVWNECSQRYELNTWVPIIGDIPSSPPQHSWTLILLGDESGIKKEYCLYFEPNDGWDMGQPLEMAYQAFPIGEEGYVGQKVFY
jgi:hypothetical protein